MAGSLCTTWLACDGVWPPARVQKRQWQCCETLRVNSAPSAVLALSFTLLHRLQNCSTCKAPCGTDSVTGDAMANSNLTQHLQMSGAADFAAGRGSADTRKGRQHSGHLLQSALWKQFKSICGDRGTVCI